MSLEISLLPALTEGRSPQPEPPSQAAIRTTSKQGSSFLCQPHTIWISFQLGELLDLWETELTPVFLAFPVLSMFASFPLAIDKAAFGRELRSSSRA